VRDGLLYSCDSLIGGPPPNEADGIGIFRVDLLTGEFEVAEVPCFVSLTLYDDGLLVTPIGVTELNWYASFASALDGTPDVVWAFFSPFFGAGFDVVGERVFAINSISQLVRYELPNPDFAVWIDFAPFPQDFVYGFAMLPDERFVLVSSGVANSSTAWLYSATGAGMGTIDFNARYVGLDCFTTP